MKILLITIALLSGSFLMKAQENKTVEKQDDIQIIKDAKAFEMKMMKKKDDQKSLEKPSKLVSEQGLDQKKQSATSTASAKSGNLLTATISTEDFLASIPNRKKSTVPIGMKTTQTVGLPNTATLEDIKKTIPKN